MLIVDADYGIDVKRINYNSYYDPYPTKSARQFLIRKISQYFLKLKKNISTLEVYCVGMF